ncbi:uncharacterized protein [Choristoneura fumiferana]|uniref:uncharacterized protein n=1 Tax=Choristoneura fumiferana TaxID=7141 RepID=UPI003D154716
MEMLRMLSLQPPPRGSPRGGPFGGGPSGGLSGRGSRGDTRDTRIPIDELMEALAAEPSSQDPGFGHAAAGDDSAAAAGDSDAHEDWRTRGLLNTVKQGDTVEIERLRGLVDTRLHMAVRAQDLTALCTLLADGASPAALDWEGRTALHLCVVYGLMKPFKVLLGVPGAADVRDASGWPLLHATILHGWHDGTRAALAAGARVDATGPGKLDLLDISPFHYKENRYPDVHFPLFLDSLPRTAIEVAMNHDMDMLESILSVAKDSGVIDCLNTIGHTALHTAIWLHNRRAMETLLMYGASPHKVSDNEQSALHVAAAEWCLGRHHPDILEFLLNNTDVQSTLNEKGLAPEHLAILTQNPDSLKLLLDKFKNTRMKTSEGDTPLHLAAIKGGDEMAKIILERDLGVGAMFEVNEQGYTPLHLAAKNNNKELAALLLLNGANLSTKTKNDDEMTVLELISTNFYDSVNFLERLFDGFIYNTDDVSKICVHSDYEVLTNGKDMSQIKALEEFVKCDQTKVLIHPLIESLIYLKWKHFQPLFFGLLCFYGIFLVFFNSLTVCIFYLEDKSNNSMNVNNSSNSSPTNDVEATRSNGFHGGGYWLLIVLTYLSILTLVFQESMFIYLKRGRYFKSVESWVKLIGLILCAGTPLLAALVSGPWPRHVACVALLLAWLQAMFLVSRFSRWGYYVLMFGKVAVNILKILVTAVFLVIAFAFCFMIQYHSSPPFDDPFAAFVKTLVMMSSEFEYENLFGEAHDPHLQDTRTIVRLMFVTFVIFVAIVLMNFMIGVAVSDINDLNETGKIRRLEKQVELLSTFEPLAYEGVLAKWFIKLFGNKSYHYSMYTFRGNKSLWHVTTRTYISEFGVSDANFTIQIRSSKLYNAIVETPSKQQQQDQEAAKHNLEKPYRSQYNALNNALVNKAAGVHVRGDEDLVRRKDNHFDSIIYKQYLSSLVDNSSKIKRDIEILKRHNNDLNLQITKLSAMSSDILRSIRPNSNWTALGRLARRSRRRFTRNTRRPMDKLFQFNL